MFSSSAALVLLTALVAPSHVAAFWAESGPSCTVPGAVCPSFNNVYGTGSPAINDITTAHCAPDLYCGDNGAACSTDDDCWSYCGTGGICGGVGALCDTTDPSTHLQLASSCNTQGGIVCNLASNECQVGGSGVASRKKRSPKSCESQGMTTCDIPIPSRSTITSYGYECVDTQSSLEQCGGCDSLNGGVDCTALPNVTGVECVAGGCVVDACEDGYTLSGNQCI